MKYSAVLSLAFLLAGCASSPDKNTNNQEILDDICKIRADIKQLSEPQFVDQNFDGNPDFFTEYFEHSYVMFFDRDFDGNPDEKYEYDTSNDFLLDGRLDENFDGYFETQVVMRKGIIKYKFIDSNLDNKIDIVKYYNHGVLNRMEIYTETLSLGSAEIKTFTFDFGIPSDSNVKLVKMSPSDFHLEQIKK